MCSSASCRRCGRSGRSTGSRSLPARPRPRAGVGGGGLGRGSPDDLGLGDRPVLEAGAQVVLDGRLVTGAVAVDESQLTGESDVVRKRPGDDVFSGSFATSGTGRYVAERVS